MSSLLMALVILFVVALGFRELDKNFTRLDETRYSDQDFNNNDEEES